MFNSQQPELYKAELVGTLGRLVDPAHGTWSILSPEYNWEHDELTDLDKLALSIAHRSPVGHQRKSINGVMFEDYWPSGK